MNLRKENIKNKIVYILFLISAIILGFRARYSFCWSDESFYFSTTDRFLRGDQVFVHEWFPTQLVSIILLPFQGIYQLIAGSNDGVILYFRLLYVLFSLLASISICFFITKRHGQLAGMLCGLFYQFYVHLNIATMNYYSLSEGFFILSIVFIYVYPRDKKRLIAAGFLFALSVLSLPSLAAAYFVCAFLCVVLGFVLKSKREELWGIFIWTLCGIVVAAVPVLIYVIFTSGISGIIDNLGYVLSDEEHATSLVYPFKNFFLSVYAVFGKKTVYLSGLISVCGFLFAAFRKRMSERMAETLEYVYLGMNFCLFIFYFTRALGHTGFIATAFLLFAMPIFFITEKKNYRLFILLFMGGMIFSMTYSYSSLCDLYVLSIGHNVAAIAGICFVMDYIKDKKRFVYIVGLAVLLTVVCQTVTLRFVNVYRDDKIENLTECITDGPARGLYTSKNHFDDYNELLSEIEKYNDKGQNIFFTKLLPWGYLATDMKCGALTTWRTRIDSERLLEYYEVNKEKYPDVVFLLKDQVGSYETCGDVEADPCPNVNELKGRIWDEINSDSYDVYEEKLSTVYVYNKH